MAGRHRELAFAQELERWTHVRAGLAEGRFSVDHARIIAKTLTDLPSEVPAEVVAKAEAHLCDLATQHRPGDLRRLAAHLIEVVAPDIADEAEARAIQRLETAAEAKAT